MKIVLQTRLMLWKKQTISLLFWLVLPAFLTWFIVVQATSLQEETKVPIGIVVEEDTLLTEQLVNQIQDTPHIRPVLLDERDALHQLQKHELDSVFIVRNRYEDNIQKGSRNQLIKSYQSDMSIAYTPIRETVISYVQQDYGRSKAAYVVQEMGEAYGVYDTWTWDELMERSKAIEKEQKLLEVDFTFGHTNVKESENDQRLFQPWNIWALLSMLATCMIFDWVIKENRPALQPRFAFSKIAYHHYILFNIVVYTALLFIFDLLTMEMFAYVLGETVSFSFVLSLLSYRLMLNSCIFMFSKLFRSVYVYYTSSFVIVLFTAIISGALIPIEGITRKWEWMKIINPLDAFLSGTVFNVWLVLGVLAITGWYVWKGKVDA